MEFKDVYQNNQLTVGEKCYWDHSEYVYKGLNEEGKHIIERKCEDGIETKLYIEAAPTVPQLPIGLYVYRIRNGKKEYGEITKSFNMMKKHYYTVKLYSNSFKGHDNETYSQLVDGWEIAEENPYLELDEVYSLLVPFDDEISNIEKQIAELKAKKQEIEIKRKEITAKCKHEWYKGEEEEVDKKYFQQECECVYCGEKQINTYYTF